MAGMRRLRASTVEDSLRRRVARDGYVFLPGLIDPASTEPVLEQTVEALHSAGWLRNPGSTRLTGEHDTHFTAHSFTTVYPAVQRLESFHRLAHHPRLLDVVDTILLGDSFCHPAKAVRLAAATPAGRPYSTIPHQDFVRLHLASDVLTAWVCLTDCTAQRQGLRILGNSHRGGFLPTDPSLGGTRPVYLPVAEDDPRWLSADYCKGDVVIFHSLTVHAGGPNRTDTIRLSADLRYQRRDEPIRTEWVHPHGWPTVPDWPELTRGWSTDRWVAVPADVDVVDMPDIPFDRYLAMLIAPHSRLLDS